MKLWKKVSLIILSIALLILISYSKFHVINPLSSVIGLICINAMDTSYVEIQNSPRVVLAKSDDAWNLFLKTLEVEGYRYLEHERMGSLCVFEKNGVRERVFFSVNGYYSVWEWENKGYE